MSIFVLCVGVIGPLVADCTSPKGEICMERNPKHVKLGNVDLEIDEPFRILAAICAAEPNKRPSLFWAIKSNNTHFYIEHNVAEKMSSLYQTQKVGRKMIHYILLCMHTVSLESKYFQSSMR